MKKIDIINVLKANDIIKENKELLSCTHHDGVNISEEYWFPNIPELKEYFDILKEEVIERKTQSKKAEEFIKTTCTHDVRLRYFSFLNSQLYECVLCHHMSGGFMSRFSDSSYINNHTVTFDSKYQTDEYGASYQVKGKTVVEVRNIITNILEKYEDGEEVDLVEEFSSLNLENVAINKEKRKKEKFILIIGGSNSRQIDYHLYIKKDSSLDSVKFFDYFKELLNVKLVYIENSQVIEKFDIKDHNILLCKYEHLEEYDYWLDNFADLPFDLIIDLSQIFDYKIIDNSIEFEEININLKDKFPNSKIVKIKDLTDHKALKEIRKLLLESNDYTFLEQYPNYYYLEDDQVAKGDDNVVLAKIKRLIKRT